ncbi:MAG: SPOR domain-containing protein [Thiohalomonadaceae bacterium]
MARDQDTSGSGGNEPEFEDLFAQASDKARAKGASEESLDELEAFLDAFEKDPEAASANLRTSRTEAPETAPAVAASSAPVADFSAPEHVEALVHGLLKDDDFDLAVTAKPRASRAETAAATVTPASPTTARSAPGGAQRPAPLGVAAVAMSTAALLIAIGAGWASFGAVKEPAAVAPDPALGAEVAALKQRLAAMSARLEGPVGDITESYPRDMDALGKRIDELHAALVAVEQRLAAAPAAPAQDAKTATRNEPATLPPAKVAARESWQVNLVSFTERAGAEVELKRARAQGMNAQIVPAERDGRTWYRVAVVGFTSAEAARAYVVENAKKAGYSAAWIARP